MEEATGTGTSNAGGKRRLRIIFDGVIAVGPPPPEKGSERPGPYFGVMARSTRRLSERSRRLGENPGKYIPMHVPSVYTTMAPFGDGRQPDQVFQLLKGDVEWNIWHPLRERLEFRFDDKGDLGTLTYDHATTPRPGREPGRIKVHSISRVPDARLISPDQTHLLEGLLSPEGSVREEAAAQILVPWGEVAGAGIFDKEDGVEVVFESARGASGRQNVVPNTVVSVDVEYVEIVTYSLDSGEQLDSLKFQLTEDAEIWVSNGDPSDTAVDLDKLSDERRGTPRLDPDREPSRGEIETFTDEFEPRFGFQADRVNVRSFVSDVFTSGGGIVRPSALTVQPSRSSEVDIDFELFSTITGPPRGIARALATDHPVPVKADGLPFEGPNCLVKQVECFETLNLKSNRKP